MCVRGSFVIVDEREKNHFPLHRTRIGRVSDTRVSSFSRYILQRNLAGFSFLLLISISRSRAIISIIISKETAPCTLRGETNGRVLRFSGCACARVQSRLPDAATTVPSAHASIILYKIARSSRSRSKIHRCTRDFVPVAGRRYFPHK